MNPISSSSTSHKHFWCWYIIVPLYLGTHHRSTRRLLFILMATVGISLGTTAGIVAHSPTPPDRIPFVQQGYLKGSDLGIDTNAGQSVAVSGNTIAVAAPGTNGNEGSVYIFVRSGQMWQQQAYLTASNRDPNDFFGVSLALSGDTLVVGAFREDSSISGVNGDATDNSAPDAGAAYIFVRNGTMWTQQAYLKASNPDPDDWFGHTVAVSGDTVVVGARGERSNAVGVNGDETNNELRYAGAAYVFARNGTTWRQQAYLKASNTEMEDFFGIAVAVSGDTVVVGASEESSNATGINGDQNNNAAFDAGAVYVFVRDGATWTTQAYLKASNTESVDRFGYSVALDGNRMVVGAIGERSNATGVNGDQFNNRAPGSGAAYLFEREGTIWTQQAYLKASNPETNDSFGYAVAVSGNTVVVGARYEDSNAAGVDGDPADNSATDAGAAYVFRYSENMWHPEAYLKASNPDADDWFGESVVVYDNTVVVGASREDSNATSVDDNQTDNSTRNAGAAYVLVSTNPVITVNTTADPGDGECTAAECTLREAIVRANITPGENQIFFNIPGTGPHTIQPVSDLPAITDQVVIDGYTQPDAQPNTNRMTEPINAVLMIEIDGSLAQSGFRFTGNSWNSLLRGLVINRFRTQAIDDSRRVVLEGNFIGTDPSGTQALGNGWGISSAGGIGGTSPRIGGDLPAARNLIAGNGTGIYIGSLSFATVEGNFIGTDVTGTKALGNGTGVLASTCVGCELGRIRLTNNLISGNANGVRIHYMCCTAAGNLIGTDRTGILPLPNTGDGIAVGSYDFSVSRNVIGYNGGNGISVSSTGGSNSVRLSTNRIFANQLAGIAVIGSRAVAGIYENAIYANGTLGIDLGSDGITLNDAGDRDSGPNQQQNYPELLLAGSNERETVVYGVIDSVPNRTLDLALFATQSCDPSGYGEGEQFLVTHVVTTNADGRAAFAVNLTQAVPTGQVLTATATDMVSFPNSGNVTSEFSRCRPLAGVINGYLQATSMTTHYDPTPVASAPAGIFTIRATFTNQQKMVLNDLFFKVERLTNNNVLLNAAGAPGGVGAVVAAPDTVAAGAPFVVEFQIGLRTPNPFTFFVDGYGIAASDGATYGASTATAAPGFTYTATDGALQTADIQTDTIFLPLITR